MRKVSRISIVVATAAAALGLASSAGAQVTIGQLAPPSPFAYCTNGEYEGVPAGAAKPLYTVPTAGVVTSWSTNATAGAGQLLTFKVYRPLGPTRFQVVAVDGPRPLAPSVLNTFKVAIPVQAGDLIGNDDDNATAVHNACLFETTNLLDKVFFREGNFPAGSAFGEEGVLEEGFEEKVRLNETATILPPPTIAALSPASGSIKGAAVTIAGANFAEVKAVTIGGVAAAFVVGSEGQITATAPVSAKIGPAAVAVTTLAGTATAAQTFAYKGCQVPKLQGKKLKKAKKKLKKAGCKVGKVKVLGEATAKTGKVVKQSPKPGGKPLAPGTRVSLKLE